MKTIKQFFSFRNAVTLVRAMVLVIVATFQDGYAMQSKVDLYY